MNRKFIISTILVFIAWMGFDFLIHGLLLHSDYLSLSNLYRSDADSQNYFSFMLGAHFLLSAAFVWIYRFGKQDRPFLGQGLRYGLAMSLVSDIPHYLIYYAVQPLPAILVCKQIALSLASVLCLGVLVAWREN